MVEGATVYGLWKWDTSYSGQGELEVDGQTAATGIAKFSLWKGSGEYQFCIIDVDKDGWEYDDDLNFDPADDLDENDCVSLAFGF